tara:strand:- start:93218 stop:94585 length:1368 start_codon:yes stop_codon:yes gene_type:complete
MYKKITLGVFLFCTTLFYAQVGIGTTSPAGGAMLDIDSDNSGIIIPRVALTVTTDQAPITDPTPVIGLMVFNTATVNDVTPGFYFWEGLPTGWVRITSGASTDWSRSGNAGTISGTNFIGTTDNQALRIRTNNSEQVEISTDGRIRTNNSGSQALPTYSFAENTNMGMYRAGNNDLRLATGGNGRLQITNTFLRSFQNHRFANGTAAAPSISFNASQGTGIFRPNADPDNLAFSTSGAERMRFIENGGVVINTTAPLFAGDRFTVLGNAGEYAINGYSTGMGGGVYGEGFDGVIGVTTDVINGWAGFFVGDVGATEDFYANGVLLTSDKRVKRNFRAIDNAILTIISLKPTLYEKNISLVKNKATHQSISNTNRSSDQTEYGLIAQEVELILPDLVKEKKMNIEGLGEIDLKSVNYIGLIPIIIQSIQEQQEIIDNQESRIAKLEAIVNQLMNKN